MKTLVALSLLAITLGCGDSPPPPHDWERPSRIIHLDIIADKYDNSECKELGGVWVQGDNKHYSGVILGCVFPDGAVPRPVK